MGSTVGRVLLTRGLLGSMELPVALPTRRCLVAKASGDARYHTVEMNWDWL